jgi:tetratricopeptide (TPR) repeat protein
MYKSTSIADDTPHRKTLQSRNIDEKEFEVMCRAKKEQEALRTLNDKKNFKTAEILAALDYLANIYYEQKRYKECEEKILQRLELMTEMLEPNHPEMLNTMHNLASTYYNQGKYSDALDLAKKALEGRREISGKFHSQTMQSLKILLHIYDQLNKKSDFMDLAKQWFDKSNADP